MHFSMRCNLSLFGFVRLNNAHNGKRLGGALFKIVDRLGIAHKVGALQLLPLVGSQKRNRLGMLLAITLQIMTR